MKCMLKDGFRYLLVFFVLSAYLCCVVPVYAQGDQPGVDGDDDVLPGDDDGPGDGSGIPDGDDAPAGDDGLGSGDDEVPPGDGSDSPDDDDAPAGDDGLGSGDDEVPPGDGPGDGSGIPDEDDAPAGDDGSGSGDDEPPADDGSGIPDGDGVAAGDDDAVSGDDESDGNLMSTASAPKAGPSTEECSPEYACAGEPPKLCYKGRWIDVLDYEVNCVDGIDNDCDGTVDSEDTDCYQAEEPVKISMISMGYDVCNNNVGWSEPASAAEDCWGKGYIKDCCCCFITSHIHDLGDIFDANSRIEIKYTPGFTKGCTSPMHVSYSADGDGWELFYSADVTQETWSPKTTYEKTLTVPGNFRYIRIHIPVCYNDYSSAKVIGGPAPVCGNGICEAGETSENCPEDCKEEIKCIPECRATGTRSEGWYDSCTAGLIKWDNCEGCYAVCKAIGTRSEGWYSSCDGKLIKYDNCGEMPVCGNGICEAGETSENCPEDCSKGKTIIIRSDDIGPWWSVDNAIYVTDLVRNMGIPQTLGIVPITAGGTIRLEQDPKLVSYLKTMRMDADVEFAIHGLNHDTNEFLGISQPEAEEKIKVAKQMIGDSLDVEPVTFVPPYYAYDENALYAARSQGMKYFSAGWNAIDMGHGFLEHPPGLWNIPVTTDFYDWGGNSLYSAQEIETSCANAMDRFGTCVIVVHHHLFVDGDYNIDPDKIALLTEVMQWVKTREAFGAELKTIGKHKVLVAPPPKNKYIVFRSDDIGPFWSDDSAIGITETLRERGVPQVLSIVPANEYNDMLYDDPVMSDYLRSIKNDASVEFALHGYDHSEHEFRDISYSDAVLKVQDGISIIERAAGITPTTFVPPYHEYNGNTLRALRTGNINRISSGYDDFMNGMAFTEDEHGVLHLPIVAEFYDWGENRPNTAQEIERSCEYGMDNYNVCIVMLHHHMFVDSEGNLDPGRVKVLTDVIEWAKNKEREGAADIVRLKDIDVDDL